MSLSGPGPRIIVAASLILATDAVMVLAVVGQGGMFATIMAELATQAQKPGS